MNGLEVALCAAFWPVAAPLLALNQHFKRAMHSDEENIVAFKELAQHLQAALGIQYMLRMRWLLASAVTDLGFAHASSKDLKRVACIRFDATRF